MTRTTRAAYTEESAEVEVLLANVDKLKALTKKIQGSLQRLDTSGKSVQDAIKPIHGDNSKLQITSRNIDRINEAIEKVRQPLDKRRREEAIIRPGVQRTALPEYIASMDRTYQALNDLKHSNLRSNQQAIEEFNDLLRVGSKELASEFRDTLRGESEALEPLHYLTKQIPFPALSSEFVAKLRSINEFADSTKSSGTSNRTRTARTGSIYAEIRGPYLRQTLQNLALASTSTVKKTDPNAIYRKGTSGIGMYCLCIEGMFLAEYENMRAIFTPEQWATLPTRFCRDALSEFGKTLRELHTHVKSHLLTDCFLAYEIIEVVSGLAFRLDARGLDIKPQLEENLRPVFQTAKTTLRVLLDDTRSRAQQLASIAAEGGPVSLTTDTLTRLQTLTDYQIPLAAVLASLGESGWRASLSTPTPSNLTAATDHPVLVPPTPDLSTRPLLSIYIADMLEAMLSPLDGKARSLLRTKSAQGAFLLNTVALTDRGITSSPDLAMLITDPARKSIETMRKKATTLYLDAWREPCLHLQDVQYTNRATAEGGTRVAGSNVAPGHVPDSAAIVKALGGKERDAIKEKFKLFNTSFDELIARHKSLKMEREVKPVLAREVQALIEPLYARFYDRYFEVDRGKGKYVKYDKPALTAMLTGLAA